MGIVNSEEDEFLLEIADMFIPGANSEKHKSRWKYIQRLCENWLRGRSPFRAGLRRQSCGSLYGALKLRGAGDSASGDAGGGRRKLEAACRVISGRREGKSMPLSLLLGAIAWI